MRFAVFTHVIHYQMAGRFYAYSPYVREMNLWFKDVDELEVVAPAQPQKEEFLSGEPYKDSSITFIKIPSFHLLNLPAVLDSAIKIPFIFFRIMGAMRRADHLHLRCPGNVGLLAAIAQIFFPKKPKTVKYAGNWDPKAKQPWTYRLQKWILSNAFLSRNIKVLVYGDWQGQSKNIVPFFTASFSDKDREVLEKDFTPPFKFVYTGNLVEGKGVFKAIELIEVLNEKGINSELEIYGDGILKDSLNDYIQRDELQEFVKLKGRKSLEELKDTYKKAHFVILLSKSEGWPKTIAEGMWYGCIPIATPVSCVPWMLNYGSRGVLIPDAKRKKMSLEERKEIGDKKDVLGTKRLVGKSHKNSQFDWFQGAARAVPEDVSRAGFSKTLEVKSSGEIDLTGIVWLLKDSNNLEKMSRAAQEWSQQYTMEKFESEIKKLLVPKET